MEKVNGKSSHFQKESKMMNWRGKLINLARIRKILVVQPKPFGDVLLTSAYLPALRKRFPDAQIDFFVAKPYDRMVYKHPALDNVIAVEMRHGSSYIPDRLASFWAVFKRRYDLVIDQNASTTSTQIIALSGARYRLGYSSGQSAMFSNIQAEYGPTKYNGVKRFDMLKPFGIKEEPVNLLFYISAQEIAFVDKWRQENDMTRSKFFLYAPGATYLYKSWKTEYFAEFADMVAEKTGFKSVILWGPNEKHFADTMARHMKTPAHVLPAITIGQAAAFLKNADFFFCNDGGIYHLSVATKTPTLAFWGTVDLEPWSAQGYVPTHYEIRNPDYRYEPTRHFGFMPIDAYHRFREIAPSFGINVCD